MIDKFKQLARHIPGAEAFYVWLSRKFFRGSQSYWESRYASGGNSGAGSYERLAEFKAEILNDFVRDNRVASVIEFGCGDGNQLAIAQYPEYVGLDVSQNAIKMCEDRFGGDDTKRFLMYRPFVADDASRGLRADLALSLDVIYHLVENEVYKKYMTHLFESARRFVIVYSSNRDDGTTAGHIRHRRFTEWVEENARSWQLKTKIENRYPFDPRSPDDTSFADFYVFERQ